MFRKFICTTVLAGMLLGPSVNAFASYGDALINKMSVQEQTVNTYQSTDWNKVWNRHYEDQEEWLNANTVWWEVLPAKGNQQLTKYVLKEHPDYLICELDYLKSSVLRRGIFKGQTFLGMMAIEFLPSNGRIVSKVKWIGPAEGHKQEFLAVANDCYDYHSID